jgi:hypothetical protein
MLQERLYRSLDESGRVDANQWPYELVTIDPQATEESAMRQALSEAALQAQKQYVYEKTLQDLRIGGTVGIVADDNHAKSEEGPKSTAGLESSESPPSGSSSELNPKLPADSLAVEPSKPTKTQPPTANAETRSRRRDIVKRYCKENKDLTMAVLAQRGETSVTAIQGMVRGDRTRYSEETLIRFLKAIGLSADQW